jgi:hypothetical protein
LAWYNFTICYSNKTKKKVMNLSMLIVGFVIFSLYVFGLIYMINVSHKEQEQDLLNDPEIPKNFKDKLSK